MSPVTKLFALPSKPCPITSEPLDPMTVLSTVLPILAP